MRRAIATTAGLLWMAVGILAWTRALGIQAGMAGAHFGAWVYFPPSVEAALGVLPWLAAAAWALSAAERRSWAAAAALAAAGTAAAWPPARAGAPALAAAAAAWAPALLWFLPTAAARTAAPAVEDGGSLPTAFSTAAALWLAAAAFGPQPGPWGLAWAALLFAAVAATLAAGLLAAGCFGANAGRATIALGALGAAHALQRLVLEGAGLTGPAAWTAALPTALAFAAAWSAADPAALLARLPAPARLAALPILAFGLAAAAARLESAADWAHGAQGLVCAAAWPLCFAAARAGPPGRWRLSRGAAAAAAFALLLVSAAAALGIIAPLEPGAARAVRVMPLARAAARVARRAEAHGALFAALRRRSFSPLDRPAPPVEIGLVGAWGGRAAERPDIVILVVDSLRRDRLKAYDPGARALPAFDALAAESLSFRNAFTPYAGTVLAVASLWTGAWLPHRPLAEPYAPQNALEILLAHEGYERLVTPDVAVRSLTAPPPATGLLGEPDDDRRGLCAPLETLGTRLSGRAAAAPPLFAFAHGYELHAAVRQARSAAPDAGYQEGLDGVDACLGRFVAGLKAAGRWERTVLILTADHGDSFGEEGRWGHAYAVAPELVRVPLIVRVPARLRAGLAADLDAPAFLSDVTATLYTLLDRPPAREGFPYGRSLLRAPGNPVPPGPWLVASSYAPAFAQLDAAGRRLVVADAVDRSVTAYDLPPVGSGRRLPLGVDEAEEVGRWLLERLDALDAFYRLPRGTGTSRSRIQAFEKAPRRT